MKSLENETGEERVELADYAKTTDQEWVYRSDYRDHPTKAVAVLVYGESSEDFWIQQRAPGKCKSGYWEIVAGSQSIDHEDSEQAAEEEVLEELFGYGSSPDYLELDYLGQVHKETENPQVIDVYEFESGRTDFPGSEEVERGEFVEIEDLEDIKDLRDFTDCTEYVLRSLDSLENIDPRLKKISDWF